MEKNSIQSLHTFVFALVSLIDAYSFSTIVAFIPALKYPLQMSPATQCIQVK